MIEAVRETPRDTAKNDGSVLSRIFNARSVAIVGASESAGPGGRVLAYLKRYGYDGDIYPVNPRYETLQGIDCFPSLHDVPGVIDLAIVAVPSAAVLSVVETAAQCGVGGVVVFSAGFAEAGNGAQEDEIAKISRDNGMPVLGPNSFGFVNVESRLYASFGTHFEQAPLPSGDIAFIGQSGALGAYTTSWAVERGLGFRYWIATGNEAAVTVADCILFLSDDPAITTIAVALEGVDDGRQLLQALARARSVGKRLILLKAGTSAQGAQAALTHTGKMVGDDSVYSGICEQYGIIRVRSFAEMVESLELSSRSPQILGNRVGAVSFSGGVGVMLADFCDSEGLVLPPLPVPVASLVREAAPLSSAMNPVDLAGSIFSSESAFENIIGALLDDESFDMVVCFAASVLMTPSFGSILVEALVRLAASHEKPIYMVGRATEAQIAELRESGVLVFQDPMACVATIARAYRSSTWRPQTGDETAPGQTEPLGVHPEMGAVELRRVLASAGVPFIPETAALTKDEALRFAREHGYPVVVKLDSTEIPHKSDQGLVIVDIRNDAELTATISQLHKRKSALGLRTGDIVVQQQFTADRELILASKMDPVFGRVIMVGAGGIDAEQRQDIAVRIAPVDLETAREMIAQLRYSAILRGTRGRGPVDDDKLSALICRVAQITEGSSIDAIELNPVMISPDGKTLRAVDCLITYSQPKKGMS